MASALSTTQPTLTPEERVRFQQVYDAQLRERFGNRIATAQQRLVFTRELIQNWRRGQACVGTTLKYVPLTAAALTDPDVIEARVRPYRNLGAYLPYLVLVGAMMLVGLWALGNGSGSSGQAAQAARTPTTLPGTPGPTAAPATAVAGLIAVGQRTPTALSPDNLELAGRSFVVYNAPVDKDKNWLVSADPNYASWLPGSIVNWTFALLLQDDAGPDTPGFLARLGRPGETAVLRVRSDEGIVTSHTFRLDAARPIKRTDTDVFDIRVPGLTLIVRTDDSDRRLYLRGTEVLAPALTPSKEEPAYRSSTAGAGLSPTGPAAPPTPVALPPTATRAP
jgi:hypothetical protein